MNLINAKREFGESQYSSSDGPWYGIDEIDPDLYARDAVNVFIDDVIKPPPNARWIGFKEIRYDTVGDKFGGYIDFMGKFFPNPYFVFNSRDANDVKKSGWWQKENELSVLNLVATMDGKFAEYVNLHPDRSFHARHENTISDPESLSPLFELMGERLDMTKVKAVLSKRLNH